jgi:putative peptidoglycan lipid II flippase
MIWSPQLVALFAGKFAEIPGKFQLAVALTRSMFPFLLLVALAAQAMGVLNANNRFGIPALASSFFNIASLTFGLAAGFWIGPRFGILPIQGMAYGVVFGGAVQLLVQLPELARCGFVFHPRVDWSHPALRHILALMGPAILGNAAVQVNVLVNTSFAAGISDPSGQVMNGPVSWLLYAFRFMQLPLGLFGVAIASATLPSISRSAAAGNLDEFRRTLSRSLGLVFLLTVPSSIGLAVLGEPMIAAIYQGGRFQLADTHQTALALSCYALGLTGYAAVKILAPAFYAINDVRTPMLVSLTSIAINYFAASSMVRILGHAGLALSTSLVAWFSFLALLWALRVRIGGLRERDLLSGALKVIAASLAMGAVCYGSSHLLRGLLGVSKWARLADLAVSIPLGLAVFYALARLLRVAELEMMGLLRGKIN